MLLRRNRSDAFLALLGELEQGVYQFGVFDPGALPHLWVHRDRGEAGHGVNFVNDQLAVVGVEEVHPGQAGCVDSLESGDRLAADQLGCGV